MPSINAMILKQIAEALNTDEVGPHLIQIARNAHRAEMELAPQRRKLDRQYQE